MHVLAQFRFYVKFGEEIKCRKSGMIDNKIAALSFRNVAFG